ncbi:MAG: tyrosine-type recombinase/integrase [Verrucomicrobia bacterium]|nr:tyrosine-type recombinase/integrase [Verrucomicrobiota bacterium]
MAQKPAESEQRKVKFPQVIRHRRAEATIYGKSRQYPRYRLAYYVAGQRRLRTFATFGEAKAEAERIVRELASGSQTAVLTGEQSRDALAALERLESFRQTTGQRISLLSAVSEFVEAAGKLNGHTLGEAVERFLGTVASVRRKDIAEAVEEFIQVDEPRTRASEGQRSQLSAKYAYNRAIHLRRFAETFKNTAVCDLSKEHLDIFLKSLGEFSAKSRNHHRAAIRQFLSWCVRKDCLPATHRLGEADSMRPEHANTAEISFYTPNELRKLLETAEGPMRAMVAISGLAGLRTAELLRLDWADVWRVPGHIEITSGKSKTRQRRLVEICPSLSAWLEPFRNLANGKLWSFHEITFQQYFRDLCEQAKVKRKANGLRHAFCTYHFAAHANENLTTAQAGNSPAMIHAHYKGLATKAEAEKCFNVMPAKADNVIALDPAATK